jgi:hypothetical protein
MESLAALVAGIFAALIAISVLDIVFAVMYRRGKVKLWVPTVINSIVGLAALWAVSVFWTLAIPVLIGLISSSIIITLPKKKRAD